MEPNKSRRAAQKAFIKEIIEGTLVVEEKEKISLLKTPTKEIYKLNLVAVVVGKEKRGSTTNLFIDDGTGKITVRFFEDNAVANTAAAGDVFLIIGKTRSYMEEKYISPEIVKKIEPLWLKVRSLELLSFAQVKKQEEKIEKKEKREENEEDEKEYNLLPFEKIIKLIKDMDFGEGVFIEEIVEKSYLKDIDKILEKMLEKGDIFQNQPGKVKVL